MLKPHPESAYMPPIKSQDEQKISSGDENVVCSVISEVHPSVVCNDIKAEVG
jgi:hypothetical protein